MRRAIESESNSFEFDGFNVLLESRANSSKDLKVSTLFVDRCVLRVSPDEGAGVETDEYVTRGPVSASDMETVRLLCLELCFCVRETELSCIFKLECRV